MGKANVDSSFRKASSVGQKRSRAGSPRESRVPAPVSVLFFFFFLDWRELSKVTSHWEDSHKRACAVWVHLHELPRVIRFIKTEC